MNDVHYNAYCSKPKVHKSNFLWGSITTNDNVILLTIEGNWLEIIAHMIEFEFLNLAHLKQVQLLISICV
jgi:mRNA-degrading endonuclease HigB of HigAB toxin-antitoxin module